MNEKAATNGYNMVHDFRKKSMGKAWRGEIGWRLLWDDTGRYHCREALVSERRCGCG